MTRTFKVSNGDWVISEASGQPTMVEGRTKLRQDIRENLSIETQASGFGAGLELTLGEDVDPFAFQLEVNRRIRQSINTMQRLQDQFLSSQRPDTERIESISSLRVTNATFGGAPSQTGFSFQLAIRPVAGETLTTGGTIT